MFSCCYCCCFTYSGSLAEWQYLPTRSHFSLSGSSFFFVKTLSNSFFFSLGVRACIGVCVNILGECLADPKWIKSVYEQFRKRRQRRRRRRIKKKEEILLGIQTFTQTQRERVIEAKRERDEAPRVYRSSNLLCSSPFWMVLSCVYSNFIVQFSRVYFEFYVVSYLIVRVCVCLSLLPIDWLPCASAWMWESESGAEKVFAILCTYYYFASFYSWKKEEENSMGYFVVWCTHWMCIKFGSSIREEEEEAGS